MAVFWEMVPERCLLRPSMPLWDWVDTGIRKVMRLGAYHPLLWELNGLSTSLRLNSVLIWQYRSYEHKCGELNCWQEERADNTKQGIDGCINVRAGFISNISLQYFVYKVLLSADCREPLKVRVKPVHSLSLIFRSVEHVVKKVLR